MNSIKTRRSPSWGLAVLGASLVVMGLIFAALLWKGYRAAARFQDWEPHPCTVVAAWVETIARPGVSADSLRFRVRYRYEVAGVEHLSERIGDIERTTTRPAKLEALKERYPVGAVLTCYVNPAKTSEALLKRPTRAPGYTIWFPGLFVAGGVGMMIWALAGRRAYSKS